MSKLTPQNPKLMGLLLEFIVSVTFVFVYVKMMHIFAGLRLGLKNRQVGEKWISDDCSYLCKGLS
jgi:hypothetical protein